MVVQSLDECWFGDELRPIAEAMGLGDFLSFQGYGRDYEVRDRFRFLFRRGTIAVLASGYGLSATLNHEAPRFVPYVTIHGSYDEVLSAARIIGVNLITERSEG